MRFVIVTNVTVLHQKQERYLLCLYVISQRARIVQRATIFFFEIPENFLAK